MVRNHIAATNRVEEETLTTGSEHIVVRGEDDVARWVAVVLRQRPAESVDERACCVFGATDEDFVFLERVRYGCCLKRR